MADRIFLREVKLEVLNETLLFYQNSVGNVSCVVWDAALALTKYIEKRAGRDVNYLRGQKVVELGAGLGCVGIAAACYGADVVLTDLPEVVPQLVKTVDLNKNVWSDKGAVKTHPLPWGQPPQDVLNLQQQPPDMVLMSDCVYYNEGVEPLIETLNMLCKSTTEVIICQEKRDTSNQLEIWKHFFGKLQDFFTLKKIPLTEQNDIYASPDIYLYTAFKK